MIIVSPRVKIKYFLCKRLRNIHLRAGIQPKNVSIHFFICILRAFTLCCFYGGDSNMKVS